VIVKLIKSLTTLVLVSLNILSIAQQTTVVINEIYFDTNPTVGLPAVEYVELFNISTSEVNLNGWVFKDAGSPKIINEDFVLAPNKYVLLTKPDNAVDLNTYGDVIGVSSFPALNDPGDDLILSNPQGDVVHEVLYKKGWLNDSAKEEGGWALELIDPNNYCELGSEENWGASIDESGGTPGRLNSIAESTTGEIPLTVKMITMLSSNKIEVQFTGPIESSTIKDINNYSLSGNDIKLTISYIFTCSSDNTCVEIEIIENFDFNTIYSLTISNVANCDLINFIGPGLVLPFEIVINEILYDPLDDVAEYIELYNQSNKIIDLNNLNIQDSGSPINILTNKSLLKPNTYALLTEDTISIRKAYNLPDSANLVEVENLPDLNNSGDVIRLSNIDFSTIDSIQYSPDWHFRLLDNTKGVALERISFTNPSQDATNWQSASKAVNFGTPGYQNSQTNQSSQQIFNEIINIENKTVSPDNDGFEDLLIINYQTEQNGVAANLYIFNERGQLIAHPIKNELLGNSGIFKWDGLDESGARIPIGIYIAYAEFFNLDGTVNKQKIPIVVAGKL